MVTTRILQSSFPLGSFTMIAPVALTTVYHRKSHGKYQAGPTESPPG
jgi:hypothetical protein